jgi:predicted ATPase
MISQVSLRNVRLFGDESRAFQLKPLTVFCGSNSSGKSTILKVFPLLRQTQGIRESAEEVSGKLRFKGTQVDLGNYFSLVTDNEIARQMHFGIRVRTSAPKSVYEFLLYIKRNTKVEFTPSKQGDAPEEFDLDYSFVFVAENPGGTESSSFKSGKHIGGNLLNAEFEVTVKGESLLKWSVDKLDKVEAAIDETAKSDFIDEITQRLYKINLPSAFFEKVGMAEHMQPQSSENPERTTLIALLRGLLPVALIANPKTESDQAAAGSEHSYTRWPIPPIIEWQHEVFKSALLNLNYVAPLRTPGKRYYITELDSGPGMDPTGEFLPYILRDKKQTLVLNTSPNELRKEKNEPLSSALGGWLRYLRTGTFVGDEQKQTEFELATSEIHTEVKLKSLINTKTHSLADSGFGYSQIVPILVRGLLAPADGTLVVEQPELHLHPALQVRIADFFLAMASIGKQVIIETHSEHLVNAIRVKAAEDTTNELHKLCKIYFLSTESEKPQVRDLSVQADGSLNEWPECFFGEALTLSGRLLRAQNKMRINRK